MTEAGPLLAPGKDCFPILVNSRGFKLWRSHIGTNMNHETYVFLERFGKPGGAKEYLYPMDSVLPSPDPSCMS